MRSKHPRAALLHPRSFLRLLIVAAGTALAAGAGAQQERGGEIARSEAEWLQAIQHAARRLNYSGTIVYQQGGAMHAARITHYFDGTSSFERVQSLDGRRREIIRRDDEVQCLFPDARRVVIERRALQDAFPSFTSAPPADILQQYALRVGDIERVADLECRVIAVDPKDDLRYGYRLCVERVNGLLLRAQTLDNRQDVLEQVTFSEVRIGERLDRARIKPSWPIDGWQVERSTPTPVDLAQQGWNVQPPAGFRKLNEIARRLRGDDRAPPAMQAVYSDGLATLSVFIEPGVDGAPAAEATHRQGPTSTFARRVGEALVTVIGEVPPGTVKSVAHSVEYRVR
jgi:sigma-E factor negative regulatory protein RseB